MPNLGAVANTWQVRRPANRAGQTTTHPQPASGLQPLVPTGPVNLAATGGNATADGGSVALIWVHTSIRQLGDLTVTALWVLRPASLTHIRAIGNPTITGSLTLRPAGQRHTRGQGNPTLSARALPPGLAHSRTLGAPAVNGRTITVFALDRA